MNVKTNIRETHGLVSCVNFEQNVAAFRAYYDAVPCEPDPGQEPPYYVQNGIAVIGVKGFITHVLNDDYMYPHATACNRLEYFAELAANDDNVTSVQLRIDSDGGITDGLVAAYEALRGINKPLTAYVVGNALSAAYYLACAATDIQARASSRIGSIGMYAIYSEYSGMDAAQGIKRTLFSSDSWKGLFSGKFPISIKESNALQNLVDQEAQAFREAVALATSLSVEAIKALDGDDFIAKDSLEIGLISSVFDGEIPMFTQEQVDQAAKEAVDAALATAAFNNERFAAIAAHPTANANLKKLLAGESYQNLNSAAVTSILDAAHTMAATALDVALAGAGVGAAPIDAAAPSGMVDMELLAAKRAQNLATIAAAKGRKGL